MCVHDVEEVRQGVRAWDAGRVRSRALDGHPVGLTKGVQQVWQFANTVAVLPCASFGVRSAVYGNYRLALILVCDGLVHE